ncbi:hypothetical protein M2368_001070 [Arthrobacter sp. JUb119]|nr:hypothetical protein [Arthrobacter sp. JUb119]
MKSSGSQRLSLAKRARPSPALITEFIDQQRECGYAVLSVLPTPDRPGFEGLCAHVSGLETTPTGIPGHTDAQILNAPA